jgi:hypothetical protein
MKKFEEVMFLDTIKRDTIKQPLNQLDGKGFAPYARDHFQV